MTSLRVTGPVAHPVSTESFKHEYPVKMEVGKWYSLVCGVDLQSKTVKIFLNGDPLPPLDLPRDFAISFGKKGQGKNLHMKKWLLKNYDGGHTFHGLVDEGDCRTGLPLSCQPVLRFLCWNPLA